MAAWLRVPGVVVAGLDDGFVAFSPLSGETHLLNPESVAVLDALDSASALTTVQVCEQLSQQFNTPAQELSDILAASWDTLVSAGLVRAMPLPHQA
jgi:PqqD family protein of HPr-rel-A system